MRAPHRQPSEGQRDAVLFADTQRMSRAATHMNPTPLMNRLPVSEFLCRVTSLTGELSVTAAGKMAEILTADSHGALIPSPADALTAVKISGSTEHSRGVF